MVLDFLEGGDAEGVEESQRFRAGIAGCVPGSSWNEDRRAGAHLMILVFDPNDSLASEHEVGLRRGVPMKTHG